MMGPRNLHILSILLLLLSTFTTAWPWPRWLPEMDSLVVRQESEDDSTSSTPVTSSEASQTQTATQKATQKATQTDASSSDSKVASETQTDKKSASPSVSISREVETIVSAGKTMTTTQTHKITAAPSTKDASHTTFGVTVPAGQISMVSPAIIDGSQFYKFGDNVTFEFGYKSVLATPSALNVMASCTANNEMYTITTNFTVSNATGTVVWDTEQYKKTGLTETYTLIIYDSASNISATAEPGYMAVYDQYTFGMYVPQRYTPLADWQCATCSGALGHLERMALTTVVGVGLVTVLSFTWFVNGLGVNL